MRHTAKRSLCAVGLAAALLLAGCGGSTPAQPASSAAASSAPAAPEGPKMTYSQTETVPAETYRDQSEFADFLGRAEAQFVIPGLAESLIPQGMDLCDETGILYISGYSATSGKNSALFAVDTATGELTAEYILQKPGGLPFDGHVGGVAVTDTTLYLSGTKDTEGRPTILALPLSSLPAEGHHEVVVEKAIPVPASPSFLSCSGGYLWVGNFYHPGADYGLSPGMDYTTADADGNELGCYILGYALAGGGLTGTEGDDYAQPDVVLVGPDKIQGVAVQDGAVTLSQSYGRKNNAALLRYWLDLDETLDTMLTVNGRDVKAYVLDSRRQTEAVTAMPMTEALADTPDGGIYILFESGAAKYANGNHRTDRVWKIKF